MRKPLTVILALVLAVSILAMVLGGKPDPLVLRQPLVVSALQPMGSSTPSWQTMVLYSVRDVNMPRTQLFAAFDKLPDWPRWGHPMVVDARWVDLPGWRTGGRFERMLDLGFPVHRVQSLETIYSATPGRFISWGSDLGWARSSTVWSFEDLATGGVKVTEVAIFHGPLIGVARLFIERRWQDYFDRTLDGLIAHAQR